MEPLARVELSLDAPAEVLRLLPLVGLRPVIRADADARLPAAPTAAPPTVLPVALRIEFGRGRPDAGTPAPPLAPATITIASDSAPSDLQGTADLVTDSAIATVCFILSRILGLAAPFLTADAQLFDVVRAAIAVARGSARILVEGEIGVGKESLIKLIYSAGRIAAGLAAIRIGALGKPSLVDLPGLVHAECAGLTAATVDAEIAPLLVHVSSPDPACGHDGGGAIFFNRIGELTPAVQRKLLDLLRSFAIEAPGRRPASTDRSVRESDASLDSASARERRPASANLRMLAASTRPLAALRAGGAMLPELHDLFDVTLTIAPLRARRVDLPLLVRHYLHGLDPSLSLNAAALRALSVYPFPGNVLELINFVTRVAIVPPKAGSRRIAIGSAATGIVGRAEVISQLDRGSLNTIWHSRDEWNSRAVRVRVKDPARASLTPAPALAMPAALRLTTGTVPRLRKPRGGHSRPRA